MSPDVSGPPADDQAAATRIALENVRLAAENVLLREDAARHEIVVDDLAVRAVELSGLLRGMARRASRSHREALSWLKIAIRADGEAIETRARLAAARALADRWDRLGEAGFAGRLRAVLDGPAEAPAPEPDPQPVNTDLLDRMREGVTSREMFGTTCAECGGPITDERPSVGEAPDGSGPMHAGCGEPCVCDTAITCLAHDHEDDDEMSRCPNDPPCPHSAHDHDHSGYVSAQATCCVYGCACGHRTGTVGPAEAAEPAHEVQCPQCGATIRARMADAPPAEAGAPETARASYRMFRAVSDHMPVYGPGVFAAETVIACRCGVEKGKNDLYGGWWAWHVAHVLDDVRPGSVTTTPAAPDVPDEALRFLAAVIAAGGGEVRIPSANLLNEWTVVRLDNVAGSVTFHSRLVGTAPAPEPARPAHPVKPRRVMVVDYPPCPTCPAAAGELCLDLRDGGRHIFTTHAARMKLIRALGG